MAAFKEYEAACSMQDSMGDLGNHSGASWDDAGAEQVCNSCAGHLITDGNTISTECPFCGNTAIIKQTVSNALRPDFVIPFKHTKDDAIKQLKSLYRGKKLLPKCFNENTHIENVTGLYVPFWLYDCNTQVKAAYDTTRISRWTRGNTSFTKTEKFMVTRNGNISFDKVPANASSRMLENDMQAIEPFNYSEIQPFSSAFLAGYVAEKHDVDFEKQKPDIDKRIRTTIDRAANNTVRGYDSINRRSLNINVTNSKVNYALLPVWTLSTKYKDKVYKFSMNGQTGQCSGRLPVDNKKAFRLGAIITAITAIVTVLLLFIGSFSPETEIHPVGAILGGLMMGTIIGLIIAAIVVACMKKGMKIGGRRVRGVDNYASGFEVTHGNEIFLGSQVTSFDRNIAGQNNNNRHRVNNNNHNSASRIGNANNNTNNRNTGINNRNNSRNNRGGRM